MRTERPLLRDFFYNSYVFYSTWGARLATNNCVPGSHSYLFHNHLSLVFHAAVPSNTSIIWIRRVFCISLTIHEYLSICRFALYMPVTHPYTCSYIAAPCVVHTHTTVHTNGNAFIIHIHSQVTNSDNNQARFVDILQSTLAQIL